MVGMISGSGAASHSEFVSQPDDSVFRFACCLVRRSILNVFLRDCHRVLEALWVAHSIWKSAAFHPKSQPCVVLVSQQGCIIGYALFLSYKAC